MSESALALYRAVGERVRARKVFAEVSADADRLRCRALETEVDAFFYVEAEPGGRVWVGMYTPDRWLSESIEADLMHTGDKLEELLEEELIEQGYEGRLDVEHFRSEDKLYTFRSPLELADPASADTADRAARVLLAYEACFRELGDMSPTDELV